jgi:hypothetical protein
VKGEKRVLVAELRALRDMGLYQGPLTRDGNEFGAVTGPTERAEEPKEEQEAVTVPSTNKSEDDEGKEVQLDLLPFEVMLLELEDRKRVINSMLKADPGIHSGSSFLTPFLRESLVVAVIIAIGHPIPIDPPTCPDLLWVRLPRSSYFILAPSPITRGVAPDLFPRLEQCLVTRLCAKKVKNRSPISSSYSTQFDRSGAHHFLLLQIMEPLHVSGKELEIGQRRQRET